MVTQRKNTSYHRNGHSKRTHPITEMVTNMQKVILEKKSIKQEHIQRNCHWGKNIYYYSRKTEQRKHQIKEMVTPEEFYQRNGALKKTPKYFI